MKKNEEPLMLAKLKCIESVIVYGRNSDGKPDHCFQENEEYLFCYDTKKGEIFTYNDVGEMHFLNFNDYFTDKYFVVLSVNRAEECGLDELNLARYKKMYVDRYEYSE
ncbi:hypothetical protein [Paenibacillus lautus]|uniref:hypothetical protein n=1 Tax=Paenibacillus lautus TaxID=1401 RepID=UPI001C7CBAB2|nr:hypothetical protein [Paenibacillus lautus]MBX4152427.1 hypothetical protein [Paenibacillus lautus]